MLHEPSLWSGRLIGAMLITFIVQGVTIGAYAARLAGVQTKRIATSISLFNLFTTVGRLATLFSVFFVAPLADAAGNAVVSNRHDPALVAQWQSTYGAQGLSVIGFTNDTVEVAAQSAQAMGMTYTVASDASGETSGAYGVGALPTMFLVDKKGVIRDVYVGFDPGRHHEIERSVRALLAEPAP